MEEQKKEKKEIIAQAREMGVDKRIVRSLSEIGFERMTPIQEQTIPLLLAGKDVIGQAQTGTGKTASFGIPILQNIDPENKDVQAIVLCPTRELAIQAADELRRFAKYMHGIKVLPVYGGQDIRGQIKLLKNVQIVVGTPGRVMDHMRRHTLRLEHIRMVVLDEADEMLNMGFREDIESILKDVPSQRQTALFSATMPQPILDITHTYQKEDAEYIKVTPKELTIPLVKQYFYAVRREYKQEVTARLLDYSASKRSLIFCNTKKMVDDLAKNLSERGYQVEGLHGDLTQTQRDRVMNGFRKGTIQILIATDVAARGIDVDDVEVVINYDVPQDNEYYVHRIGRTGRAGKSGTSHTLAAGRELYRIHDIEKMCRTRIEERKVPSASDVINARAQKTLSQVMEICRTQELARILPLVEKHLEKENITALELAAAFLRLHMGEEPEEIPEIVRSQRGRGIQGRTFRDRGDRRRNERDKAGSGRNESGKSRRDKAGSGRNESGKSRRDKAGSDRNESGKNRRNQAGNDRNETGKKQRDIVGSGRSESSKKQRDIVGNDRNESSKKQRDTVGNDRNENGKKQREGIESDRGASKRNGKRKRHDHSGENGKRRKLITGENKDYGYDTDVSAYHMRERMPGHALEIKMKEPAQEVFSQIKEKEIPSKKSGFLFFKRK